MIDDRLRGIRENIRYLKSNKILLVYSVILTPLISISVLLLSNPFFSYQSILFDITSIFYVISENYWLLEHTAGAMILPIGILYSYLIAILFILTFKQITLNKNINSAKNVFGIIPAFFVGCAGCSAGILGFFTTTGLAILPFSSFAITYVVIFLGFIISIYSLNRIGNPEVCNF